MKQFRTKPLCATLVLILALPASAHHSRSNFDNTSITFTGTVTEFAFTNPHIFIEVLSEDGVTWLVESHSVTAMRRRGWTKDTFKPGETLTITGTPDKDPAKKLLGLSSVSKADGSPINARGANNERSAPITPSTDFSGTWGMDMRSFDVRAAGGPPPKDWPYTEVGARMAASYDAEDSPELACKEIGVPRIIVYPYSINFTRTDVSLNVFKEHLNEKRTLWFNADQAQAANEPASPTGTSIATQVSGTELHVITDNFTPTEWGIENALDSSDQKQVAEVYKLSDDGLRMDVTLTITDPVVFTEPVIRTVSFNKQANREFADIACDPRAASRHVTMEKTGASQQVGTSQKTLDKKKLSWWQKVMGKR